MKRRDWVFVVLGAAIIGLVLSVRVYYVPSGAMRPTLIEKDRILASSLAYRLGDPARGDLVVFTAPAAATVANRPQTFLKRVVGLPGETIEIRALDGVYINGAKLDEPYIGPLQTSDYDYGPSHIPAGHYFILGDNRRDSNDSHRWGPLSRKAIRSKVILRIAPARRIGVVR